MLLHPTSIGFLSMRKQAMPSTLSLCSSTSSNMTPQKIMKVIKFEIRTFQKVQDEGNRTSSHGDRWSQVSLKQESESLSSQNRCSDFADRFSRKRFGVRQKTLYLRDPARGDLSLSTHIVGSISTPDGPLESMKKVIQISKRSERKIA